MHCKNPRTILLQLDEAFYDDRLDEINVLLTQQYGSTYKMVNWIEYRNEHGVDSDDSQGSNIEIADNTSQRSIVLERRRAEAKSIE